MVIKSKNDKNRLCSSDGKSKVCIQNNVLKDHLGEFCINRRSVLGDFIEVSKENVNWI
jgi:hypothetical protein